MVLDTDHLPTDKFELSPDYYYPTQNLDVQLISLDNNDGVGDLKPHCLTGLQNVGWTPFTAYGVGGLVTGVTRKKERELLN